MTNFLIAILFPAVVCIGILFSWEKKRRKVEKRKPEYRVTVFYNGSRGGDVAKKNNLF